MTDDERMAALERSNKLLARDNKSLARDVKRLEEKIAELSIFDEPARKGWRFKNLPNGDQVITPIE